MAIPVTLNVSSRTARGNFWSSALLPRSYPYALSYITTPTSQRILPLGNNQAGDPRSSGSYGSPSWEVTSGNSNSFFPQYPACGGAVLANPASNRSGLLSSNFVIFAFVAVAAFFLFRRA